MIDNVTSVGHTTTVCSDHNSNEIGKGLKLYSTFLPLKSVYLTNKHHHHHHHHHHVTG